MAEVQDKIIESIPRFILPKEFSNEPESKVESKTESKVEVAAPLVIPEAKPVAEAATTELPLPEDKETTGTDPEKQSTRRFERRIDKATKRAAEAEARAESVARELAEIKSRQTPSVDTQEPKAEDFTDITEFGKAQREYGEKKAARDLEKKQRDDASNAFLAKLSESWEEKVNRVKYDDFDEKVGDLKPTSPWSIALMQAENGEEVAYYLGTHAAERKRIFALDPLAQAREIGKLEQKLSAPQSPQKPSKAPAPIVPLSGSAVVSDSEIKPVQSYEEYRKIGNRMFRGS